ncbi:MAG: hypothetical protein RL748_2920 [Pseudomonadota bacterium]
MPTPPISAILWDNDGVLVDTEHLFYQVNRELFHEHGIALTAQHFFDWFLQDNCGAWHLLTQFDAGQIVELRNERNRRYSQRLHEQGELLTPGIGAVVQQLAQRFRMAVVTSARHEDFHIIHRNTNLLQHFEFVLTDSDYVNSKPSPEPYLLGLQRLGLTAQQALVVEDSPRGLQAALAAGIGCIGIRSALTANYPFEGALCVVENNQQLLQAIEHYAGVGAA